jgi:hypothetical protein
MSDDDYDFFSVSPNPIVANPATAPTTMAAEATVSTASANGLVAFVSKRLNSSMYRVPQKHKTCQLPTCTEAFSHSYHEPSLRNSKDFWANQAISNRRESDSWDNPDDTTSIDSEDVSSRTCLSIIYEGARGFTRGRNGPSSKHFEGNGFNRSQSTTLPSVSESYYADQDENDSDFDISPSDSELRGVEDMERSFGNEWHNKAVTTNRLQNMTRELQIALWGTPLEERNAAHESQSHEEAAMDSEGENSGIITSQFLQKVVSRPQASGTSGSKQENADKGHSHKSSYSSSEGGVPLTVEDNPGPAASSPLYTKIATYRRSTVGDHSMWTRDIIEDDMRTWILDRFAQLPRQPVVRGRGLEVRVREDTIDSNGIVKTELIGEEFGSQALTIITRGLMCGPRVVQYNNGLHGDRYTEESRPLVMEIIYEDEEHPEFPWEEREIASIRADSISTLPLGSPESALGPPDSSQPSLLDLLADEAESGYVIDEGRFSSNVTDLVMREPPVDPHLLPSTYVSDLFAHEANKNARADPSRRD